MRINNNRLEHHSRGFFAIEQDSIGARRMESLAIAAKNENKPTAYVAMASSEVDNVLGSRQLTNYLIRGSNARTAARLRALI